MKLFCNPFIGGIHLWVWFCSIVWTVRKKISISLCTDSFLRARRQRFGWNENQDTIIFFWQWIRLAEGIIPCRKYEIVFWWDFNYAVHWRIRGWQGRAHSPHPRGPNSFISMQFSAKNLQNNPNLELAHPPPENPGSATVAIASGARNGGVKFTSKQLHISSLKKKRLLGSSKGK